MYQVDLLLFLNENVEWNVYRTNFDLENGFFLIINDNKMVNKFIKQKSNQDTILLSNINMFSDKQHRNICKTELIKSH